MGDRKFTLLELHLDGDTQFGPTSIPGVETADAADDAAESDDEDDAAGAPSKAKGALGAIVGLVAVVALGAAIKKLRGGDEDEAVPEHEEPDVVVG
jgi:hypothetical protein